MACENSPVFEVDNNMGMSTIAETPIFSVILHKNSLNLMGLVTSHAKQWPTLPSKNLKFPYPNMDSPQNLGLDASSTKQIGEGHPTPSWPPNHHFGYSTWPRPNKAILWLDS